MDLDRTSLNAGNEITETGSLLLEAMAESRYQQARVDQASASIASLEARMAADDARYHSQGDPKACSSLAYAAEKAVGIPDPGHPPNESGKGPAHR